MSDSNVNHAEVKLKENCLSKRDNKRNSKKKQRENAENYFQYVFGKESDGKSCKKNNNRQQGFFDYLFEAFGMSQCL